ncbi:MAG: precorrin-8X methylmutase [Rhodothermaceae bacterium]
MQYIVKPNEIEKRSFEIISKELGERKFPLDLDPIIKRVIHTTADFEYADLLCFQNNIIERMNELISNGAGIVSDTNMILNGVNKAALQKAGCKISCFMSEPEVAAEAKARGITRAIVSMEYALKNPDNKIFLIGNAPTALFTLLELSKAQTRNDIVIVGVPVGFVGAEESKDQLLKTDIPSIVVKGRKGGSTVAVAIMNALLYGVVGR